MLVFIAVCCAVLFYRLAYHEHLSAGTWAVASLALSGIVLVSLPGLAVLLLAQLVLFGILWWANSRRIVTQGQRLLRARDEERRLRRERVERAREEAMRKQEGDG